MTTIKQRLAMKLYKIIQEKIELNYCRVLEYTSSNLNNEDERIRERCRLFLHTLNMPEFSLDKQRLFCATWFRKDLSKWIIEDDIMRFFEGVIW